MHALRGMQKMFVGAALTMLAELSERKGNVAEATRLYEKAAAENAAGTSAATGQGNDNGSTDGAADDDIIDAEIVDDESVK